MAADYWRSTSRRHWLFEPHEVAAYRLDTEDLHSKTIEMCPLPDRRLVFIFIKDRLLQLSKRLQFRQQSVATALVYLHRYFLFNPIQSVNLYQMVATAFYLASKTDESPHHIRLVASEARQAWPEYVSGDVSSIGELEFCLISEMHSQLIVWHPYRSLMALKENRKLAPKNDPKLAITNEELALAWSIINDTFMTDIPLTTPPHLVAIVALFLAVAFVPNNPTFGLCLADVDEIVTDPTLFASLSGRKDVTRAFGQALGGVPGLTASHSATCSSTSTNSAVIDRKLIKSKTAAAVASSEKMQNIIRFLAESDISISRMIEITQIIISLYEIWETYNEKSVKDVVNRNIRTQGLER